MMQSYYPMILLIPLQSHKQEKKRVIQDWGENLKEYHKQDIQLWQYINISLKNSKDVEIVECCKSDSVKILLRTK